ncbi:MAG: hypothetical protein SFU27_05655 [Thermonemataceae bacterium]|nr:hypothetical protein [Thermonemataceae bacterium]
MTANFKKLWELIELISEYEKTHKTAIDTPSGEVQKSLFEAIKEAQKEEKSLEETLFDEIKKKVSSKNFNDVVDELTETLLENLREHLYSLDLEANIPKNELAKLSTQRQKHLSEQRVFKKIYAAEFLFENQSYELAKKELKAAQEIAHKERLFSLYSRMYDMEMRFFSSETYSLGESSKTLKIFFELAKSIEEMLKKWEQKSDILDNLSTLEQNASHFSFYHLLFLHIQNNEKTTLKIENFEHLLDIKTEKELISSPNSLDYLFRLNIYIRQYFELYKKVDVEKMKAILQKIRRLKTHFLSNENIFFTSFAYFLENLIFGLEHKYVLELQNKEPEISLYELLQKRGDKIEENLKIFSQKTIDNLIWRHHLNIILLNFRLFQKDRQSKEAEICKDSIEKLTELPSFHNKYSQYLAEIHLMKAILIKFYPEKQDIRDFFRGIERKDKIKEQIQTDFYKTIKKILLDNQEVDFVKSCKKHEKELEKLEAKSLLQQAILDFCKKHERKNESHLNEILEPIILEKTGEKNVILEKINIFQKKILMYASSLQNRDWESFKSLFPPIIHKYILLYDHSVEHIINNLDNFYKNRKNIHYAIKTEEMLVKIHGDLVIVPIAFGWQHGDQEPYEALVETRFQFDGEQKIKVLEELKIIHSKGIF